MAYHPLEHLGESTMDDVIRDPNRYGAPTFEQFKANKEKYLGRKDDTFNNIDKGSHSLRKLYKKQIYEIEGRRTTKLEEVERIAKSELGLDIDKLDYRPQLIPQGGGNCEVLVKFVSKADREKRSNWG